MVLKEWIHGRFDQINWIKKIGSKKLDQTDVDTRSRFDPNNLKKMSHHDIHLTDYLLDLVLMIDVFR